MSQLQRILSIDASIAPAEALILEISENESKIVDRLSVELGSVFNILPAPPTAAEDGASAAEKPPVDLTPLRELSRRFHGRWDASILIVPPLDFLTLNIELPFNDRKNAGRVIPLEVQDLVPFEIDDFVLAHQTVGTWNGSLYDTFISLAPKSYIREIVKRCKEAEFEPFIITTPASALAPVFALSSSPLPRGAGVICYRNSLMHLVLALDGTVRQEKVIGAANEATSPASLLGELQLAIASFEERYHVKVEKLLVVGEEIEAGSLAKHLGREIEVVASDTIRKLIQERDGLAGLAALLLKDEQIIPTLSNFRVGEFSYSPYLIQAIRGAKTLLPYFATLILIGVFAALIRYSAGKLAVSRMQNQMASAIAETIPAVAVVRGNEAGTVLSSINTLESELKQLGSPARTTPLEALLELAKIFSATKGVVVTSFSIDGEKIEVEGTAPDFTVRERLEKALDKRSDIVCRSRQTASRRQISGGQVPFQFNMSLC